MTPDRSFPRSPGDAAIVIRALSRQLAVHANQGGQSARQVLP